MGKSMDRICSFGCILAVTIWSTHDFEAQKLAIVEILWHGSEATVQHASIRTWNAGYGEYYLNTESPPFSQFRVEALLKHRGAMKISYDSRSFSGTATHPIHDPAAAPDVLLSKSWAYFVSRSDDGGLAVYFKLFREGASPKDSAALVREWMKLGQYRNAVRGGP